MDKVNFSFKHLPLIKLCMLSKKCQISHIANQMPNKLIILLEYHSYHKTEELFSYERYILHFSQVCLRNKPWGVRKTCAGGSFFEHSVWLRFKLEVFQMLQ